MSLPFVTCLCLTKNRREWLPGVVGQFRAQDYAGPCELLIVADSWNDCSDFYSNALVVVGGDRVVSEISVIIQPGLIGEKRNAGCGWAAGSIIAIWDDDDYSSPGRLTQQVEALQRTGKQVTGYSGMKFTDGWSWWQRDLPEGFVHGTSLCFTRDWWEKHPFPDVQIGEDVAFVNAAHEAGELAAFPDLNLMYAGIHAGNTCLKQPDGPGWVRLPDYTCLQFEPTIPESVR